jgi:exodeoxyribonuclease V gamma subunit
MNDGDYPRRSARSDFDLMALPGQARPGDRSRRDDDRYLMLEAVLAARDQLYVSWVGRNVRDNSEQPPSVLVAQLRDYLAAGWGFDPGTITTVHALQPFSRRYFEAGGLPTYAGEWRAAHGAAVSADAALPPFTLDPGYTLRLGELAEFLRQPARHFFRQRLQVRFSDSAALGADEEPFTLDGLQRYVLEDGLLDTSGEPEPAEEVVARLAERSARLGREGVLPIGLLGRRWEERFVRELAPVRTAWLDLLARFAAPAPKLAVGLELGELCIEDWIDQLRTGPEGVVWLAQAAARALGAKEALRLDKLGWCWLRQLAAAAAGTPVTGFLVARDVVVSFLPLEPETARTTLATLAALWRRNLDAPLPVAARTALVLLTGGDPALAYDGAPQQPGEGKDLCLARLWPEYALLAAEPDWPESAAALYGQLVDWAARHVQVLPLAPEQP